MKKMIRIVSYYRAASTLPLVVPIIAFSLGKGNIPSPFGTALWVLWFSLFIGGIPYCLLAAFAYFWMKNKSEKIIHRFIYISPLLMVILIAVTFPLTSLLSGESPFNYFLGAIVTYGVWTIIVGYSYVAVVQLVYWALKVTHKIESHNQEEAAA